MQRWSAAMRSCRREGLPTFVIPWHRDRPQLDTADRFELYAGVRPDTGDAIDAPVLADPRAGDIDF